MPLRAVLLFVVTVVPGVLAGCGPGRPPEPGPQPIRQVARLGAADLDLFLAVRTRALDRMEVALAAVERSGGDVRTRVQELSIAERTAVDELGVDWRHYSAVRDRVGEALTEERQLSDRERLWGELRRTREDLVDQRLKLTDPSTRQFLDRQIEALDAQLKGLRAAPVAAADAAESAALEAARPQLATLQARQDRLRTRVAELLARLAAGSAARP